MRWARPREREGESERAKKWNKVPPQRFPLFTSSSFHFFPFADAAFIKLIPLSVLCASFACWTLLTSNLAYMHFFARRESTRGLRRCSIWVRQQSPSSIYTMCNFFTDFFSTITAVFFFFQRKSSSNRSKDEKVVLSPLYLLGKL